MKHTIDDLKQVWLDAGYTITPYSKEEIDEAEKKVGKIPLLLREYYEKIGNIDDEEDHPFYVDSPYHLSKTTDGETNPREILLFGWEMQGVCEYGIDLADINDPNPLVYCAGDPYYEISKLGEHMFVPGTNYDIPMGPDGDMRTLMHTLWTFAYCALMEYDFSDIDIDWEFEDDDIYGYTEEQITQYKKAENIQETAWAQEKALREILVGEEPEDKTENFLMITSFEKEFGTAEIGDKPAIPEQLQHMEYLGMATNLQELMIGNAIIDNTEPLSNLVNLTALRLKRCVIKDLSFLASLKSLKSLSLVGSTFPDIEVLKELPGLKKLYLSHTHIANIDSLSALENLEELIINGLNVTNIEPLRPLKKLKTFYAEDNQIEDISPLEHNKNLDTIYMKNNCIKDISVFKNFLKIDTVDLSGNQIEDITPLKDANNLHMLDMNENPVRDISALENKHSLTRLKLNHSKIGTIESLRTCENLHDVMIKHTKVADLSPLTGKPIEDLYISYTQITDISSITMPLDYLDLRGLQLDSLDFIPENCKVYFPWFKENQFWEHWYGYEHFLQECFWEQYVDCENEDLFPKKCLRDIKEQEKITYTDINFTKEDIHHFEDYKNLLWLSLKDIKFYGSGFSLPDTVSVLMLNNVSIESLDIFDNLKNLRVLSISDSTIQNFSFLEKLPNLDVLSIQQDVMEEWESLETYVKKWEGVRLRIISDSIPEKRAANFVKGNPCSISLENGQLVIKSEINN